MAEDAAGTETVVTGGEGDSSEATAITDGVKPGEEGVTNAQADGGENEDGEGSSDEGAPEAYEDFNIPEGTEVDKEALKQFQDLAREFNLTQDKAQKLVDFQAAFAEKLTQQNVKVWEKMRTDWLADSKADKDIGGQNFEGRVESSKRALTQFGTPALVEVLETYGLGNHPEIIRFTARVGDAIGDDTIVPGSGGPNVAGRTQAQRMFGASTRSQGA